MDDGSRYDGTRDDGVLAQRGPPPLRGVSLGVVARPCAADSPDRGRRGGRCRRRVTIAAIRRASLEILRRRYAAGEISKEEFEAARRALGV